MAFARFMSEPIGRILRALAGIALIVTEFLIGGTVGLMVRIIGLVPLAARHNTEARFAGLELSWPGLTRKERE